MVPPRVCFGALLLVAAPAPALAQVLKATRISDVDGGFTGELDDFDGFGEGLAWIGDLDGDGVDDLAVGAPGDDDDVPGGFGETGAVWVLFMNTDGTVRDHQKISALEGGFGGTLPYASEFASSVEAIGDLDGDGTTELAVGAPYADGQGFARGAVWILFMNPDGTVKSEQLIDDTVGGLAGGLPNQAQFGHACAALGDLDGDGVRDLAVGGRGTVYVLLLDASGSVKDHHRITQPALSPNDYFGIACTAVGDLNGDGVVDLAAGAPYHDDIHYDSGAVWTLFLAPDGSLAGQQQVSNTEGCLLGCLSGRAGHGLATVDLDGDGRRELLVGAPHATSGNTDVAGMLWILYLDADGRALGHLRVGEGTGGFAGDLDPGGQFAVDLTDGFDLDGDGSPEIGVANPWGGVGGPGHGSVWILTLGNVAEPTTGHVLGTTYCDPGRPNSTGEPGVVVVQGQSEVDQDTLVLQARQLPNGNLGIFIMGTGTDVFSPPGSDGFICVTPGLRRFPGNPTNGGGFCREVGTSGPVSGHITAGSTWNFQAWHRDGMGPSNFTNAVSVTFE